MNPDILLCRCGDCPEAPGPECNSGELKRLMADVFADATGGTAALFCRDEATGTGDDEGARSCRCPDCELNRRGRKGYCRIQ